MRTLRLVPIYEFVCMTCEARFEELVSIDADDPPCPDCGAVRVARQLSVFAAHGAAVGSEPAPSHGGGGGAGFGGCCGGGCGCG
jgi:putative FmdB family regulatory protein